MDKRLRLLIKERYGKALIITLVLMGAFYAVLSYSSVRNWYETRQNVYSEEYLSWAGVDYDAQGKEYQLTDKEIAYKQKNQLQLFYTPMYSDGQTEEARYQARNDYDANTTYHSQFSQDQLMIYFMLLIGFLLFFVDLKTNFNTFWFAAPYSRKKVFLGKIRKVALPILLLLLFCKVVYTAIVVSAIPSEYVNATWQVLGASILQSWLLGVFMFAMGLLIGTLCGNLILGPITLLSFGWLSFWFPQVLNLNVSTIHRLFKGWEWTNSANNQSNLIQNVDTWFVTGVGKSGGHWFMAVFFILLSSVCFVLALSAFKKISLENTGSYLLLPQWRPAFWLILSVFLYFMVFSTFTNWDTYFWGSFTAAGNPTRPKLFGYILWSLIQAGLIFLFFRVVLYFKEIKAKVGALLLKRSRLPQAYTK